jgi:hypothetical protein
MYYVKTQVSSFPDGRSLLATHESLDAAIQDCAEWAEYDDVRVWVEDQHGGIVHEFEGYADATEFLYPEEDGQPTEYEEWMDFDPDC